ncbi:Ras family protein [Cardiosporidium cionae]|uniref:Ras family protein n=1 Tax=Cardiosporidium cionae TaxID=476202 RepID=A0ABQ7JD37_9APIC|nr:Ras family protein [Cardiosporidium cionae]|eukprot:KAF8821942.1 Ras family protein [Cardiosporidium cionae]
MENSQGKCIDYIFKIIIIGNAGAGKSCLMHQFIESTFRKGSSQTIGVEFGSKLISLNGKQIKLQLWDTAGQERYRSVTRSYYRGAVGALVVYDVSNQETYNHMVNWLANARTLGRPDISIVIVGNKIDLKEERQITFLQGSTLAQENETAFMETSAFTGEGVEDVFLRVGQMILSKIESEVIFIGLIDSEQLKLQVNRSSALSNELPKEDFLPGVFSIHVFSPKSGAMGDCLKQHQAVPAKSKIE